jgi:hypothetical protein
VELILPSRENAARGASILAVWALSLREVSAVLEWLTTPSEVFAAVCLALAGLLWATEDSVPWKARAADLVGTVVVFSGVVLGWLVDHEQVLAYLDDFLLDVAVISVIVGTVARSLLLSAQGVTGRVFTWALAFLAGLMLLVGAASVAATQDWGQVPFWLGRAAALVVAFLGVEREQAGQAAASRSFQYGSGSTLLTLLAAALAVGTYTLAERNDYTWDLTRKKSFSLSEQAKRVADAITYDVKVTAFFRGTAPGRAQFADLIERFTQRNGKITVEWIDPLQEPRRAEAADITGDHGTVLLEGNERTRRLEWEITEGDLVRELVLLSSNEDHHLCWSLGHGEPHPDDEFTEDGLGVVRLELEGLNYEVAPVEIAKTGVPRDCAALIVARPNTEWQPSELEALAAYLAEGGRAVVMLDAGDAPELAEELERYGVLVGNDVVVDLNLKNQLLGVNDPSVVVLSAENFGQHPITQSLGAAIVMPIARSVRASKEPPAGITAIDLLRTSPEAWGETDPGGEEVKPDEGLEVVGEVPVMAVVEITDPAAVRVLDPKNVPPPEPGAPDFAAAARGVPPDFTPAAGGRLVVIGDSDFAANRFVGRGNNRDLFLNTIAWLVDEKEQLGERPETGDTLEISAGASALLCFGSMLLLPGAALVVAAVVLLRRRRL